MAGLMRRSCVRVRPLVLFHHARVVMLDKLRDEGPACVQRKGIKKFGVRLENRPLESAARGTRLSPVAEALDAQLLQVVSLEIPKHLSVDVVVHHEALVLLCLVTELLIASAQKIANFLYGPFRLHQSPVSNA